MNELKKTTIEIQYFLGCPHSDEMINRVREVIEILDLEFEYREILINSPEEAQRVKFRGSPTLLVNGKDLENLPEPKIGAMACRYYKNGIPAIETLKKFIKRKAFDKNQV